MTQKQSPRMRELVQDPPLAPVLTDEQRALMNKNIDVSTLSPVPELHFGPDLTPLLRIATLAQRMAERYVSGKHGLAIENAAHEVLHLWDELPDELRALV